jgi:GH15 family glucan-1,4-alpha-glucosidase
MKLALIGNCAYQSLVDDRGRIVWLCWPRFDSSFVFGALLDEERGGVFSIESGTSKTKTSQQYIDNTNILRTHFTSDRGEFEVVDFAPRFRQYERFFKPTMLVRRIRPISGEPVVRVRCRPRYDYGRIVPQSHHSSNHVQWQMPEGQLRMTTDIPLTYIEDESGFLLEHEAWLVLTWGLFRSAGLLRV